MHRYLKAWIEHCHELQSQGPKSSVEKKDMARLSNKNGIHLKQELSPFCQRRCLGEPLKKSAQRPEAWCFQGCLWGQSPSSAIFSLVDLHYQAHLMYLWINLISCLDKIPQTRCLNPQRFIFSQFWSLESKIKVLAGLVLSRSLLGSRGCILAVSPCTLCSECMLLVSMWQNVLSV